MKNADNDNEENDFMNAADIRKRKEKKKPDRITVRIVKSPNPTGVNKRGTSSRSPEYTLVRRSLIGLIKEGVSRNEVIERIQKGIGVKYQTAQCLYKSAENEIAREKQKKGL
ncbi:MAG: hypothetical protein V1911_01910 [Candidatus Micrarchaeota archaeon]